MRNAFLICAMLLACAPCLAGHGPMDATKDSPQEGQALTASHPSSYYRHAARIFQAGSKDEAVFWFYVGQIRYRFHLAAHPDLPADGDPALFASLTDAIGTELNEWAGGDPDMWVAQMERALEWDASNPNGFTSKEAFGEEWQQVRAGLVGLKDDVSANKDYILSERKRLGLPNRSSAVQAKTAPSTLPH